MLVQALYNVVDRIFVEVMEWDLRVGRFNRGFPVMLVQMAFSMLIGLGARINIYYVLARVAKRSEQIMSSAFGMLVIISAALTTLGIGFWIL